MHDCQKTKEQLIDLIFDELPAADCTPTMSEVHACQTCRQLHSEMVASLALFDAVADTKLPSESYWSGYEARLLARLHTAAKPRWRVRFAVRLPFAWQPGLAMAAGLLLFIALALVFWLTLRNRNQTVMPPSEQAINQETTSQREGAPEESIRPSTTPPPRDDKPTVAPVKNPPRRPQPKLPRRGERNEQATEADEFTALARIEKQIVEHLADAELLFRSFRNARPAPGKTETDVAFEKGLARKLLRHNAALKDEAEAIGYQAASAFLSNLEPFLLEIANLADQATADDLHPIKRLLEDKGIVTELHLYSALAIGRGL